jgi:predicted metalloendopeptidase
MRSLFRPAATLLSTLAAATLAHAAPTPVPAATPCADFDTYINGRWTEAAELPADRSNIGSFITLRMANARLLETALAELAADPARQTSPGLKVLAAHYSAGMDTAGIEKRGLAPLAPLLERIAKVRREGLPALLGALARSGTAAPLAVFVGPDAKDATRYAVSVSQSGLGLPDRDDYFRSDEHSRRLQAAYRGYARKLLEAAHEAADDATLDALIAFETQLAQASSTRVQRRDPLANYNPFTVAGLKTLAPGFDWQAWLTAWSGRVEGVPVILGQPGFAKAVAALAADAPLDTWRAYLRVRLLDEFAPTLPSALRQAEFDYRGRALRGLTAPLPRVEQVMQAIGGQYGNAPLGEALGELYAAKAFSPLAQQRALQMFDDIRAAMRLRIDALPWMNAPTKVLARAKLDAMAAKIGAPAHWRQYEGLALAPDNYAGNQLRIAQWQTAQRLADLDRAVDRSRWSMSPYMVNAQASFGNQIVIPAGILQPPFFDAGADDASNYGGIGMVIGHEITHHFDDRGRQFDASGSLRDWWTPEDAAAYKARADRVAQLYSGYEPVPGVHINGQLTLGENLSDFGGLSIAYQALQIALARQRAAGKEPPLIDGLTPEQRFFTANALIWRSKARTEALVDQLRTDGHSPGRWRVLAPMSNSPAFAKAFGCKPGDAMVAAEPISIW